ncbi:hypothetical protein D1007_41344 [Hordeum vulgare]|nr:hypothetical protein D1007_41344 [Hordeum vulgare]
MVAAPAPAAGEATPPPETPPSRVSVRSSSSSSRRRCALSSRFREPASPRRHAWVSLQGRLVGAEEAASADAAAPGLPTDGGDGVGALPARCIAFSSSPPWRPPPPAPTLPAASSSSSGRSILGFDSSYLLHFDLIWIHSGHHMLGNDEVLQSMQQKLDDLLGEMHSLQQQYVKCDSFVSTQSEKVELVSSKKLMDEEGTRCCACSQLVTAYSLQDKGCLQSDFCGMDEARSDVVDRSSISLVDHEARHVRPLRHLECHILCGQPCNGDNQRIAELQDILRRKNMVISKLKKDMSALKQMVVELTRAKRASYVNLNTACSELQ